MYNVFSEEFQRELLKLYRKIGYVNLHLHTDSSHLDGMNDIPNLIKRLKEIGHDACAVTDHGNAHNLFKFYKSAIENGIKPILGVEFYVSYSRQLQNKSDMLFVSSLLKDDFIFEGDKSHLVVLAKDFIGYQNLCRLVTLSNKEGFYGKPRVDFELLRKYKEGLIVINGHVGTDIAESFERFVQTGNEQDYDRAYQLNDWYKSIFGEDYYLEIQDHGLQIEKNVTPHVIELAHSSDVKLVMTNDSHYTWREDADIHRAHMANGLKKTYEEFMDGDFEGFATCDEFYIKENDEMLQVALSIGDVALQALLNTHEIVEKCNVEIPYIDYKGKDEATGKHKWKTKEYLFPKFDIPAPYKDAFAYFKYLTNKGLQDRAEENEIDLENYTMHDYQKRLDYEISVIENMNFATYFLVLWDKIRFCQERDIPVGKGRGSGAGSLVCHSLRITDVDPIKYSLIFERFLNPDRISMPDVDTDYDMIRVHEVIDYVIEKYGSEYVCKIGTFGTLSAKASIKDMARVLKYDFVKINSMTTKITKIGISINEILGEYKEVKELYDNDAEFKRVVDYAHRLEGMQRHTSQHAAGVVISPFPLSDLVPLKGKGVEVSSQFDMNELEELGFVKFDVLKLRTLSVIKNAVISIEDRLGIDIDINKIDFEDKKVYEKFQEGDTSGIFQFESDGMQALLKRQQPTSLNDLSAINALYRPGPLEAIDPEYNMSMANVYVERAGGRLPVKYMHPLLEEVQKDTLGVFVYQETVMRSAVVLAGYTLSESDDLRKAIGKKILEKIAEHKDKFVDGCLKNEQFIAGCGESNPRELATHIYGQIETFARYGFNRSHSMAYAILAYQSMWLKTYYPEFFMASVLTSLLGKKIEEVVPYLNETRRLGFKLLPPDVNTSSKVYEVSKDRTGIHFCLSGVNGVGPKAVDNILEVRTEKGFKTLSDFIMITSSAVNKTVVVALAKAGAFDFLGYNRKTMVKIAEDLIAISSKIKQKIANNKKRKKPVQDISSFYQPFYDYEPEIIEEYTHQELCSLEKSLTGFYMTYHPLDGLLDYIQSKTTHTSDVINNGIPSGTEGGSEDEEQEYDLLPKDTFVITGGVIKQLKEITIKRGRNQGKVMASFILEDAYQGDIKCTAFYQQYEQYKNTLQEGKIVFIKGNIDYFNDTTQVNINEATEVSRDTAKSLQRKDLMSELSKTQQSISEIEETIELLGDDADLIVDVTNELVLLYELLDELEHQLEEVEFA